MKTGHGDIKGTERGFTLIELIIVMVVLVIIMAIAIPTFIGQRRDAVRSGFRDGAKSYVTAIEAFRLDNAGKVPKFGDVNQWPNGAQAATGPVNRLIPEKDPSTNATQRRHWYMHEGVPDSMVSQKGTIDDQVAVTGPNAMPHIQYIALPDGMHYTLVVTTKDGAACFLGEDPGTGAEPCDK